MKPSFLPVSLALAALMMLGLFACAKSRSDFVIALEHSALTAQNSTNLVVSVSSLTDFEWDKLFIFPPYTPVDKIQAQLGYKWNEAEKTHIDASEDFHLLVFLKSGKVVYYFKISRQFDFQNLEAGNIFSPKDDTFEVKAVSAGKTTRLNLFPKHK